MPRPLKTRRIGCKPNSNYFKPRGIPVADLGEVVLTMDELEIVQIVPLQGKTRRLRLKKRPVRRRRNWQQQRSD